MSKFSRKKKIVAALVGAGLVAIGGGLAYAYWTSTGTGTGAATTGTGTAFVVTSTAATGGPLTPGGPTETVAFTVANPSTGVQHLTSVVVSVATSTGDVWTTVPGCSSDDYTVGTPVITYGDIAAAGTLSGTVAITMNNLTTNQDACKGASVPLYFVAS